MHIMSISFKWNLSRVVSFQLLFKNAVVSFQVFFAFPGDGVHFSLSATLSLVLAYYEALSLQFIEKGIECSMSESYAEFCFRLFFNLVAPHGFGLNQSEYLDIKQVSGDALYNFFFEDLGHFFTF